MLWRFIILLSALAATSLTHSIRSPQGDNSIHASNSGDINSTALYWASRLNPSTYVIKNHDSYVEYPFIYVKLYPWLPLALVVDTGVGADNNANGTEPQEIKDFIEDEILAKHEVPCEEGKKYEFLVFSTHCHFDHIGGIHAFSAAGAEIVSSSFNRSFVSPENRDAGSLCSAFGTGLPEYQIDRFVADGQRLKHKGEDLGLMVLQTPGHTPDSLALYDEGENWIFVGDTLYRRIVHQPWGEKQELPIILVAQSHWKDYYASLHKLYDFIDSKQAECGKEIRLGSGHASESEVAKTFVSKAVRFVDRIRRGEVPIIAELAGDEVAPGGTLGPETFAYWQDDGDPLFSFLGPDRIKKEF